MTVLATDRSTWARSVQRSETPASTPVRGYHGVAAAERGNRVVLKKLPQGLADRIREQYVLTTPGVAEGFREANALIEGWKTSL